MKKILLSISVIVLFLSAAAAGYIYNFVVIESGGQMIQQVNQQLRVPRWLSAIPIASGEIGLSWRYDIDSNRVGYNVYRKTSGNVYTKINSNSVTTTSYTDSGLTNGETYYYIVKAVASNGTESEASDEVFATATSSSSNFNVYKIIGGGSHPAFSNVVEGTRIPQASVSVGDINGDGLLDYVAWQKGPYANLVVFLHDGTFLWNRPFKIGDWGHNVNVVVGDVDGDGVGEVISTEIENIDVGEYGTTIGYLNIRNGLDGTLKHQLQFDSVFAGRMNVALADLDGDGERDEIIMTHGVYHNRNPYVGAYHGDLSLIWQFTEPVGQCHWLVIEDIDGDNKDEILLGGNTFLDHDGSRIIVDNPNSGSANGNGGHVDGIAVGDFDWNRPGLEIVFAGCDGDHVWMVDSTGTLIWDLNPGHAHWVSMGDFDPSVDGLEAFVSWGESTRYHYIVYADGTYKQVSRYDDTQPMMDWDGDTSNGDDLYPIRNFNNIRITNAYTGQALLTYSGKSSGNRGVDVVGDSRDEFIWADCTNQRIVIFSNGNYNPNTMLSKWEDSYWRLQSIYKRSFSSEYINGARAY